MSPDLHARARLYEGRPQSTVCGGLSPFGKIICSSLLQRHCPFVLLLHLHSARLQFFELASKVIAVALVASLVLLSSVLDFFRWGGGQIALGGSLVRFLLRSPDS